MVLDFTDSKNSCYLKNLRSDDSEVSLARRTSEISEKDVDRIVNNTSKFFRNLANKVGLKILGSGPNKTAICCSLGPNIQEMLCQGAQMQLVQYVKVESGHIEAKLVWFDELSSTQTNSMTSRISSTQNLQDVKSKRRNFMNLFNSSWSSLVKVVLSDGEKGTKFYHKTANGTLVPETILQASQKKEIRPSQSTPPYNSSPSYPPTRNLRWHPGVSPQRVVQARVTSTPLADSYERKSTVLHRPFKRRRQNQELEIHSFATSTNTARVQAQGTSKPFAASSATGSFPGTYQGAGWRKTLPQHITA